MPVTMRLNLPHITRTRADPHAREPRPDPQKGSVIRKDAIIIYRVDNYSDDDIVRLLPLDPVDNDSQGRPQRYTEWINDSTCMCSHELIVTALLREYSGPSVALV